MIKSEHQQLRFKKEDDFERVSRIVQLLVAAAILFNVIAIVGLVFSAVMWGWNGSTTSASPVQDIFQVVFIQLLPILAILFTNVTMILLLWMIYDIKIRLEVIDAWDF